MAKEHQVLIIAKKMRQVLVHVFWHSLTVVVLTLKNDIWYYQISQVMLVLPLPLRRMTDHRSNSKQIYKLIDVVKVKVFDDHDVVAVS